jgi:hypothetical protein
MESDVSVQGKSFPAYVTRLFVIVICCVWLFVFALAVFTLGVDTVVFPLPDPVEVEEEVEDPVDVEVDFEVDAPLAEFVDVVDVDGVED